MKNWCWTIIYRHPWRRRKEHLKTSDSEVSNSPSRNTSMRNQWASFKLLVLAVIKRRIKRCQMKPYRLLKNIYSTIVWSEIETLWLCDDITVYLFLIFLFLQELIWHVRQPVKLVSSFLVKKVSFMTEKLSKLPREKAGKLLLLRHKI